MIAEFRMGDRRGRLRRPVLVLTGTREEVYALETAVASALDGGERGTDGAHVDYEGMHVAVRIKENES